MSHRSVALLIETANAYCRGLLEGIIAYTNATGDWSVHLTEQERGALPPTWLKTWDGDGIIARIETDAVGRQLADCRLPMVNLGVARRIPGVPSASTEDRQIAKLAVDHFVERGFRHLAYCGDDGYLWSANRGRHFRRLAQEAGCQTYEHQCVARYADSFDPTVETRRISQWLKTLPRPVAVMACYDFKAHQVLQACRLQNIAVPEQAAVLGVDDDQLICELCHPKLSSIIPDTKRAGFDAAALLDRMMAGEQVDTEKPLVTEPLGIAIRASTDTLAIDDREVAKALGYIRRNATSNIRIADLLQHVALSRRSLEHRFKKSVGHTPAEEIQRVRFGRIQDLLCDTELSIGEIAKQTGFEYGEYMAAAFKRRTGSTPTQYRNANR